MKTTLFTIAFIFVSLFAVGQKPVTEQKAFENIANAVKNGQATELSAYFASSIECDILGKDNVYSKIQATQIVKDFFSKYKVKSFTTLHQSGKGQAKYIIGTYICTSGENFRMTFFVKQDNNDYFIHQIRVENNSEDSM